MNNGHKLIARFGADNPKFKHGLSYIPEHGIWASMLSRCGDPGNRDYKQYGGRGIKVCERWKSKDGFKNFLLDVGRRPEGLNGKRPKYSLERINNNLGYEPSNCKWALSS